MAVDMSRCNGKSLFLACSLLFAGVTQESTQDWSIQSAKEFPLTYTTWDWVLAHWWVYSSDTLLWPPIFDFLSFSLHHRSSDMHHADVTFCDIHANLHMITIDYTLYPSHHRPGTTLKTSHMTYRPCCFYFLFLVSFLLPDTSCCGLTDHKPSHHVVRAFTICFTAHKPCAHFTYHLYLWLLYLLWKRRKEVFPQNSDLSSFHLIASPYSISYLHPHSHYQLSSLYCTILNPYFTLLDTMSGDHPLLPNHTPQSHIGFILRSLTPPILVAS